MDIYKVKSIVKNGQLIIDLPDEFENTDVEVSVSLVSSSKEYTSSSEPISVAEEHSTAYAKHNLPNKKTDESGIIPPREKVDLRKLRGAIKSDLSINEIDAIARSMRGDSPFVPPRKRIKLSTLMGAYKHKMTNDEIDSLTKSWRSEWNRDIS